MAHHYDDKPGRTRVYTWKIQSMNPAMNLTAVERGKVASAVLLVMLFSVACLGNRLLAETLKQYGMLDCPTLRSVCCGLGFGIVGMVYHTAITRRLFRNENCQLWNHWSVIIAVGVIGPFFEELLFRSVLQARMGLATSSILFAWVHMAQRKRALALLFPVGFLFGSCMIVAGNNLWAPFIAHSCLNLYVAVSGYLINKDSQKSWQYLQDGNTESALLCVNRALSKASIFAIHEANLYLRRAQIYNSAHDYTQALESALQALTLNSELLEAHAEVIYLSVVQRHFQQGDEACTAALAIDPGYGYALVYGSWCKLNLGETEAALQLSAKAVEQLPASSGSYESRGACHLIAGQFEEALRDFNEALELSPESAQNFWYRGLAYKGLGRNEECEQDHEKSRQLGFKEDCCGQLLAQLPVPQFR